MKQADNWVNPGALLWHMTLMGVFEVAIQFSIETTIRGTILKDSWETRVPLLFTATSESESHSSLSSRASQGPSYQKHKLGEEAYLYDSGILSSQVGSHTDMGPHSDRHSDREECIWLERRWKRMWSMYILADLFKCAKQHFPGEGKPCMTH